MKNVRFLCVLFIVLFSLTGCTYFNNNDGAYYFDSVIMIEDGVEVYYDCTEVEAYDQNTSLYQVCSFYSTIHLIIRDDKLYMGFNSYEEEEIGYYKIESEIMYTRQNNQEDWVEYGEYKDKTIIKNDYTFKTIFKY